MTRRTAIWLALAVACGASIDAGGAQTKATDTGPPFRLDYFGGTWAFDWTVPETPMGPAGDLVGTEVHRLLDPSETIAALPGSPAIPPGLLQAPTRSAQVLDGRIE